MDHIQRVLVVDDEQRNQRIISEILDGVVESKVVSSGEEALKAFEEGQYDLVLLDIMMPGLDGYEVCRRVRADPKLALTRVILVSGKAMVDERLKGYELGADDYMTKPFVPEELLAKVKVFLRLTLTERELSEMNRSLDQKVEERTRQLLDAEAKLMTSAKMSALGEMAAGVAHEINTPLGTIGLGVDQIKDLITEEPINRMLVAEMAETIATTVMKISAIIQGLRTFARDGSQDRFDSASLLQIIESTLALCQEKMKNGNVKVRIEGIPSELRVLCRPVQISQVLLNLLSNACDAISPLPDKWIKIAAENHLDNVRISITDSGGGIPEAIRDKLFQPFFTTKPIGKGTGLGLSISKGIMETHRGSIAIDALSENTRFLVELPKG